MLFVYSLLLYLALRFFGKKNKPLCFSLTVFYLVSALSAILYRYLDPTSIYFYNTTYTPLLYLFFVLLIWFLGFSGFKPVTLPQSQPFQERLERIGRIIGFSYLPFIVILLYNAVRVMLFSDLSTFRNEADWYSVLKGGLFLSLGIYYSVLSFVPHILFFVLLNYKVSTSTRVLLLLASFSFVLTTLCFAGRDGVMYWIMNSVVFYFVFRDNYKKTLRRLLVRGASIAVGVMLIPMVIISAARFTSGITSISELFIPVLSYIGQPPHLFCQAYYVDPSTIRGLDTQTMSGAQVADYQLYLTYTFGTFIKKYFWNYGFWGTIGISLLFCFVSRYFVKTYNKTGSIWIFLIIYTIYQIPLYGVFYYRQSLQRMELIYIIFSVFCLIMYLLQGKKR